MPGYLSLGRCIPIRAFRPSCPGCCGAFRFSLHPSPRPGHPLAAICPQGWFWKLVPAASAAWAAPWRGAARSSSARRLGSSCSCHQPRLALLTHGAIMHPVHPSPSWTCCFNSFSVSEQYREAGGILPSNTSCPFQGLVQSCLLLPGLAEFVIKPFSSLRRGSVNCRAE